MTAPPRSEQTTARKASAMRGAVILDHLSPRHDLPVRNGWARYGGRAVAWCGWCHHLYAIDRDWAERFLTMKWRQLRALVKCQAVKAPYAQRKISELASELAAAGVDVPKRVRA